MLGTENQIKNILENSSPQGASVIVKEENSKHINT